MISAQLFLLTINSFHESWVRLSVSWVEKSHERWEGAVRCRGWITREILCVVHTEQNTPYLFPFNRYFFTYSVLTLLEMYLYIMRPVHAMCLSIFFINDQIKPRNIYFFPALTR